LIKRKRRLEIARIRKTEKAILSLLFRALKNCPHWERVGLSLILNNEKKSLIFEKRDIVYSKIRFKRARITKRAPQTQVPQKIFF
jgi:hypothetical protein